jgi:hypothetical protein
MNPLTMRVLVMIQRVPLTSGTPSMATIDFRVDSYWLDFDLAGDGTRFLAIVPEVVKDRQPLVAILHWRDTGG